MGTALANNPKPGDSIAFHSGSTAALLYICKCLLSYITPQSQWKTRVEKLFAEFVPLGIGLKYGSVWTLIGTFLLRYKNTNLKDE